MPRSLLLLTFLIACGPPRSPSSPSPRPSNAPSQPLASTAPPAARDPLSLLHEVARCPDMRNGWSGYTIFQVLEGPAHASGRQVIAYYGESAQVATIRRSGAWLVGKVTLGPITPVSSWPNQCESISAPSFDGLVVDATAFANEADARRALQ